MKKHPLYHDFITELQYTSELRTFKGMPKKVKKQWFKNWRGLKHVREHGDGNA